MRSHARIQSCASGVWGMCLWPHHRGQCVCVTVVVDRRSAEAPVRNLSKASVKFSAALGPHVKLPTEMSNFPTLGGPPGANVKLSKGSVKVYAWLGPYYPPHVYSQNRNSRPRPRRKRLSTRRRARIIQCGPRTSRNTDGNGVEPAPAPTSP